MRDSDRLGEFVDRPPEPDPEEDEGPLAQALNMADCIEDMLDEARESINLADSMLTDLRALLDGGDLHESGSDRCKHGEA